MPSPAWKTDRDPEPVLGAQLGRAPEHLGQLRSRHDAVLDVVARRDAAHRRERRLAATPDPGALLGRLGGVQPERAELAADRLDRRRLLGDLRGGPVELDDQHRAGAGRVAGATAASTASIVSASIISIAAGRIPAAITCETASPAASVDGEAGEQRPHRLGRPQHAHDDPDRDPERALGADEHAEQVGALVVARERDELAVGEHDVGGEHVVDGEAVLEAVGAARVLGDVAADRADLLARRVGRVVEAVRGDRARDVEVGHARLDDHPAAVEVDLEHAVHPRERDDDAVGDRQRPAREARSRRRARRTGRGARGRAARPPARRPPSRASTTSSGTARWPVSASHS